MSKLPPLAAIRAFEAAARLENFTRAAEELGLTQAAVSYQIRQLEDRLGQPLFVRAKGRARLSDTGQKLLPAISTAFASMSDAFGALASDDADILRIDAATTFGGAWLSARVGRFQLRYPDLAVRLSMSNELVDFNATDVDVAIRSGGGHWPGLRADFLFRGHITPICAPGFRDAHGLERPADLLRVERLAPNDPWWGGWLAEAGIGTPPPPRRGVVLDSQLQEASAVQNGFGIALMTPLLWRNELDSGRLVQPFDTLYLPGGGHFIVHRERRVGVRKIERFREWLHEEMAKDRTPGDDALWQPLD
ncbi:MAG: LysR family transcriptional regulator [Sphingopyxis sp.]|nr:LysR family transcriptional regulator [Sphingopyxis sp.]